MPGVCHRCGRNVYIADEKNAWGKVWHRFCVSCRNCRKLLDECTALTHEDEIYCSKCYEDITGEPHDSGEDADRRCGGRRSDCCRRCPTPPASPARATPCPAAVTTWYSRAHSRESCTDCVRCSAPEPWKTCDAIRTCRPPPASGSSLCESCPGNDAVTTEPEEKDSNQPTPPNDDKLKRSSCGCCGTKKQQKRQSTSGRLTETALSGAADEPISSDKLKSVCDETPEPATRRRSRRSWKSSSRASSTTADGSRCRCCRKLTPTKHLVEEVYSKGGLKVVIKSPNYGKTKSVDESPYVTPRAKSKLRSTASRSSSPDGSCCSCSSRNLLPREAAQECDCCQRVRTHRSARRETSDSRQRTSDKLRCCCCCCSQGRRARTHSSSKASGGSKSLSGNIDTSDGLYCSCSKGHNVRTRSSSKASRSSKRRGKIETSDELCCSCSQEQNVRTHSVSKALTSSKLRGKINTSDEFCCSCSQGQNVQTRSSSKGSRSSKRRDKIETPEELCRCCCSQGRHDETDSSSKASSSKRFGGKVDVVAGGPCRRCGRQVYHAEMVLAAGTLFHTSCFSCRQCRKPLEPTTVYDAQGEIFCKQCYLKRFGPNGYGYGMGAGALQSP